MEIKNRSPRRRSSPPHSCNSLRVSSPSDLPQSIFIHIMLRLPLKTIFACKCVSKTWLRMLSDPWFASQYVNRSPCDYVFYIRRPQQREADRVLVFGSCNGLLLYGYVSCPTLYVQNPFVGNNTIIIPPDEADGKAQEKDYSTTHADYTYGIGYSLTSAKYKVVKITQLSDNRTEAKIFVLGNSSNSWRSTQNSPPCGEWWNHAGVYIGGALYWFITEPAGNKYSSGSICCLDMETEKFHVLPPPPPLENFKTQTVLMRKTVQGVWYFRESGLRICNHGDSISVSFCQFGDRGRIWRVWIMKQYGVRESWVLDFVFQNNRPYDIYPLAIVSNDKIFLTSLFKGGLFTYYRGSTCLERMIDYDEGMVEHAFIPSPLSPKVL